jgi:hypothetical protein
MIGPEMRDITVKEAEEEFRSPPKLGRILVLRGERATAFISLSAYYVYPQQLKILYDCRIKDGPVTNRRSRGTTRLKGRLTTIVGSAVAAEWTRMGLTVIGAKSHHTASRAPEFDRSLCTDRCRIITGSRFRPVRQ